MFCVFKEGFLVSSVPMLLLDITELQKKCKELQQVELIDIDSYLAEELYLKKHDYPYFKIQSINQSALELFNFSQETDVYDKNSILFDSFFINIKQLIFNEIFYDKTKIVYEFSLKCFDKNLKYKIYVDLFLIKNKFIALVSIIDISSYNKSESILNEYIEKYYLLLKSVRDAILIVDVDSSIILEANNKSTEIFKINTNLLIGKSIKYFFSFDEIKKYEVFFDKKISKNNFENESLSIFLQINEFEKIPVQIELIPAVIGNKRVAQIIISDMSNRFKMEEGRRLLATAVEQAAESVIITDIFGNVQYVNPAFENISGYTFTEMLGKNPNILQSGETPNYQYKLMWDDISKGNVWRGSFTNRKKSGEIYIEEATITPVKDADNNIINYVAVKRDITQHLLLENQIRQSQKMQAIGTLAGGVAHDFNNILTAIMGYAELSQSQCEKDSLIYSNLGEIIRGADRASQLVDQILKFSRQSEKNISNLKFSLIIKEVLKLLRASLPANIEILFDYSENFYVRADPTQMHQIVMNLCTNAYQALEGKGGKITLRLNRKILSPKEGVVIGNLPHGSYVCLQVEDNGIGIPSEYLQRIFEPYFTTKKLHEGNGLGLSVVHGIVNDHRGAVTVESQPGRGSCFTVFLPEAKADVVENKTESENASSRYEGSILVVDDEQPITFFLVQVLKGLGYEVEACFSSDVAYNLFSDRKGVFDLVITDMGMPGMTGLELANKMKKINPDIPIMLCTGHSDQVTAENYQQMGLAGFVSKPFNTVHLVREVANIINAKKK